MFLMMDIKFY